MKLVAVSLVLAAASSALAADANYVIHISVDGMGSSYMQNQINLNNLPSFHRLQTEGAGTLNARNDYDYTVTLPNHTSMVTGRPVIGDAQHPGHNWTGNSDPAVGATLASNNGNNYIYSVFDVAHDNGMRTGMWAGKTKFSLFQTSYNLANGAADNVGVNYGTNKLDTVDIDGNTANMTSNFISSMNANPCQYSFVHFADPDTAGHASGWGSTAYNNALIAVDGYLGQIFSLVTTNATLKGHTAVIVSADHGGNGFDHSVNSDPLDYTIPFYVWGGGATPGANLYTLNSVARLDPGTGRPNFAPSVQPIRNGEGGNLALDLLGLSAIPGSTINSNQSLSVPEPGSLSLVAMAGLLALRRRRRA